MQYCDRCQHSARILRRSWLDGTNICPECSHLEKGCPNFQRAHLAGLNAIQEGYELPVFGLTQADLDYLAAATPKWTPRTKARDEFDYTESEEMYD